jgi:hypothetical protein
MVPQYRIAYQPVTDEGGYGGYQRQRYDITRKYFHVGRVFRLDGRPLIFGADQDTFYSVYYFHLLFNL